MVMFSSRHLDPAPWQAVRGGARAATQVAEGLERIGVDMQHAPRPEFDEVKTHAVNPILAWHRLTTRRGMSAVAARYTLEAWPATVGALPGLGILTYTPEQEEHAKRVLARIARWTA